MKKLLFIISMLVAVFQLSAQNFTTGTTLSDNTSTSISMDHERNSTWLSWANSVDDGVITTGAIGDIIFVQRFAASDLTAYNGFQLTQINFYLEDGYYAPSGSYSIVVYRGGSYYSGTSMNPGTLIYSQAVSNVTIGGATQVTLNTPLTIDASQELWFGVKINNVAADSYMLGFDETSTVTGKGSLYYDDEDMTWYDLNAINTSFTVSAWAIEAYAVDPNGDNDAIIDLGLWYIDNATDQNEITSMTVPYGSNFVPVPVVWNYNYGAAVDDFYDTLHFDLTLDGTPLGSTGASTVYIASGDGVYWGSYTALYASDIANYNLYGTHNFCMTVSTGPGWFENDPSDNTGCLTVTFEGPTTSNHVITVLNTDNSVTPSGNVSVVHGGSQTFTITPSACNTIADVLVDGMSVLGSVVNNTYTFTNVTADHTFQVTYNSTNFTLTASTNGNGSVSPMNTTLACGATQNFTITPNAGYVIDYVTDNTIDVTASVANNIYTITNIQQNHDIFVAFTQDVSATYTLTGSTDGNGTITPTNVTVNGGATQVFTIVPNSGYTIDYVTDNTMDVTANVNNNTYTLTNIANNHDIYVVFMPSGAPSDTYTVSAATDGHATVTPANSTVNAGDNLTLTITTNAGYHVLTVTDNGTDVTANVSNNTYSLSNISANHVIYVTCENDNIPADSYTVTVSTDGNATANPANTTVNAGDNLTITITPNTGYRVSTIFDNGIDVTGDFGNNAYILNNIVTNHTINVTCEVDNPNPGIHEYSATAISVFPNPANSVLNVQMENAIETVEIFDMSGKVVLRSEANNNHAQINVTTLNSGIYFIKAIANGQIATGKFVKE